MSNISRGSKTAGLLVYLQGPGKANEHTDPHLVAGHSSVVEPSDIGQRLDKQWALSVAHQLDVPRRSYGTSVMWADTEKVKARMAEGATKLAARSAEKFDAHVWHCSLSLKAEEGQLSDEKWAVIAADFMKEMGFDNPDDPRPSARWVAVRHGLSGEGNDHIHIAASLVREDGTKVDTYRDRPRSQEACNLLERRHGLEVLSSREEQRGSRGVSPAELEKAKKAGLPEPLRRTIERRVRAAATASKTEAEFVRRLRADDLLVRPRYATGTSSGPAIGYSVAATPSKAERAAGIKPVWFGGGRLAKDLTLPRLRDEWDTSAAAATAAEQEWNASRRGSAPVGVGPERARVDPALLARAAQDIEKWNTYLSSIPVDDHARWARAAGRTSGVFAAWSARVEATPGPLAATSRVLAQSAQIPAHARAKVDRGISGGGAALILLQTQIRSSSAGQVLLLRQLMRTVDAIADARRAAGDLDAANRLVAVRRDELAGVHAVLHRQHGIGVDTAAARRVGVVDRGAVARPSAAALQNTPQPAVDAPAANVPDATRPAAAALSSADTESGAPVLPRGMSREQYDAELAAAARVAGVSSGGPGGDSTGRHDQARAAYGVAEARGDDARTDEARAAGRIADVSSAAHPHAANKRPAATDRSRPSASKSPQLDRGDEHER
jgi:hypothetical protein